MAEDKKKMKARIIQEYLPRCSRYKCYTQGEIPMSKFEKARESYASGVSYRDVLGMILAPFADVKFGFNHFYNFKNKFIFHYNKRGKINCGAGNYH